MISVVSAYFHSPDWLDLLLHSLRRTSSLVSEVLIVNNSRNISPRSDIKVVEPSGDFRGHGGGLDFAIPLVRNEWVMVFDIDVHPVLEGWDKQILALYQENSQTRLVAGSGRGSKPYQPCVMFFRKDHFLRGYWFQKETREGHKAGLVRRKFQKDPGAFYFEVGLYFALKTIDDGYRVEGLPCAKIYDLPNDWGAGYMLKGSPAFYHHGFGTHAAPTPEYASRGESEARARMELWKQYQKRYGPILAR